MMASYGLEGRVVVVTGANHGIGLATARAFAAEGAAVFLHYLRRIRSGAETMGDEEPAAPGEARYRFRQAQTADALVRAIREAGGRAAAWEADLADPATILALLNRTEAELGPVQVLVNNAAHWEPDTFLSHLPIRPAGSPDS